MIEKELGYYTEEYGVENIAHLLQITPSELQKIINYETQVTPEAIERIRSQLLLLARLTNN